MSELEEAFVKEFEGMTIDPVSLIELKDARTRLSDDLRARLDNKAMRFLLTLHDTEPDFNAIGLPQAAALPAVHITAALGSAAKHILARPAIMTDILAHERVDPGC